MKDKLLLPIKSIQAKYIPLLVVYFTTGLSGLSAVTSTIFFKDAVTLSPAALISLGVYISLPWSIKMVFGSLIDSVKLFGNNRKSYIYFGQFLILLSTLGMVDIASTQYTVEMFGIYIAILISGLLGTTGTVMSDIVADVMAIELVPDDHPNKGKEYGIIQVLSRLSLVTGAVIGAALTGSIATYLSLAAGFATTLICPVIAVIATMIAKVEHTPSLQPMNKLILLGGIGYGIINLIAGSFSGTEAVFSFSLLIIGIMLSILIKSSFPKHMIKPFVLAMIAIFLFRVTPGIGPAGTWWYIESLGFDNEFLGLLRLTSTITGFLVLYFLADSITNQSIFKTMLILTSAITLLSIPDILIFYNMIGGLDPRHVVWLDSAMAGPLASLSMIPLGVLVAQNAPPQQRAVYTSLTASFMNIALVGGDVITKWLNEIFIVSRTDFTQLGELMIYSLTISTLLSMVGLVVLKISGSK